MGVWERRSLLDRFGARKYLHPARLRVRPPVGQISPAPEVIFIDSSLSSQQVMSGDTPTAVYTMYDANLCLITTIQLKHLKDKKLTKTEGHELPSCYLLSRR